MNVLVFFRLQLVALEQYLKFFRDERKSYQQIRTLSRGPPIEISLTAVKSFEQSNPCSLRESVRL